MSKYVKKFVNILPEHDAWIKEAGKRAKPQMRDVEVIRAIIARASKEDPTLFTSELRKARIEAKERSLADQIKSLERQRQELLREKEGRESTVSSRRDSEP